MPTRALWTIYALALAGLGLARTIEKITRDSGGFPSRYGPALGALTVAVGVIAYAWKRPIARAWVWKSVFILLCLAQLGLLTLLGFQIAIDGGPAHVLALIGGAIALAIPSQVALWRYGFRSAPIWKAQRTSSIPTDPAASAASTASGGV